MGSYPVRRPGSDEPAKFIVLRYHGRDGDGYDLGLVGKGITFDSGGISIKPSEDMHLMKYDMTGAAVVLAAAGVVAQLGLPINLIAIAPCTENLPGGHATKPGDVVTSMSGKTVEVINTDAEGRLVLIDGVTYAQREGATRVVDVATLTGAIRDRARPLLHRASSDGPTASSTRFAAPATRAASGCGRCPCRRVPRRGEERRSPTSATAPARLGGAIIGAAFIDAVGRPGHRVGAPRYRQHGLVRGGSDRSRPRVRRDPRSGRLSS